MQTQRRRSSTSTANGAAASSAAAASDATTTPSGAGMEGGPRRRSARISAMATNGKEPRQQQPQQQQQQRASGGSGKSIFQSGYFWMALLALQFGCQPMLARAFIPRGLPKMPVVIATEGVKILLCLGFLSCERAAERRRVWKTWSLKESLRVGLLPAALYALQNTMAQIGYQNLDSLTFNLLNQTKTLAAAMCLYLVIGRRQTPPQMAALALLLTASIMLNLPKGNKKGGAEASNPLLEAANFYWGVLPVLLASLTSGICAALTQKTLQGLSRNPYLYSLELAVYGQICLGATMLFKTLYAHHFTDEATMASSVVVDTSALVQGWTRLTWVPILTQAWGGIIVGLVTKHAGGVKKGFSLIAGIALTAFVQAVVQATPPPPLHWLAAALVALSTYMHSAYGPAPPSSKAGGAKDKGGGSASRSSNKMASKKRQ